MSELNLHEIMAARMKELAEETYKEFHQDDYVCTGFKLGYTAALNDLQGKVDGLLNALEHMTKFNWPGSSAAEFASDALSEFNNGGLKLKEENPKYSGLYPKYNCPTCGDWFHMPYKYCKCERKP